MQYSEEFLKKIKSFGALQYDVERIIAILQPENKEEFRKEFTDPESIVFAMYQTGFNAGQYRIDAEQFKLSELETEQKKIEFKELQERITLRKQLFGV